MNEAVRVAQLAYEEAVRRGLVPGGTQNYPFILGCAIRLNAALRDENDYLKSLQLQVREVQPREMGERNAALLAENKKLRELINRLGDWGKKALRKETAEALRQDLAKEMVFFDNLAGSGKP